MKKSIFYIEQYYLNDTLQYKNFKISIVFVTLQGIPALLMPWMLYTIVFLFTNTALHTQNHLRYLAIEDTTYGVGNIVAAQIYFCK